MCPTRERLNPKYVKKTFKGEEVKVMVWACFRGERLGPLIVCDEGGLEQLSTMRIFSMMDYSP